MGLVEPDLGAARRMTTKVSQPRRRLRRRSARRQIRSSSTRRMRCADHNRLLSKAVRNVVELHRARPGTPPIDWENAVLYEPVERRERVRPWASDEAVLYGVVVNVVDVPLKDLGVANGVLPKASLPDAPFAPSDT